MKYVKTIQFMVSFVFSLNLIAGTVEPQFEFKVSEEQILDSTNNPAILDGQVKVITDDKVKCLEFRGVDFKGFTLDAVGRMDVPAGMVEFSIKPFFSKTSGNPDEWISHYIMEVGAEKDKNLFLLGLNKRGDYHDIWLHVIDPGTGKRVGISVPIDSKPGWHQVKVTWQDGSIILNVDGIIKKLSISGKLAITGKIKFGGYPYLLTDSLVKDLKFYNQVFVTENSHPAAIVKPIQAGLGGQIPVFELGDTQENTLSSATNAAILEGEAKIFQDEGYKVPQMSGPDFKGLKLSATGKMDFPEGTIEFYIKPFFSRNSSNPDLWTPYLLLSVGVSKEKEKFWIGLSNHGKYNEVWAHVLNPATGKRVGVAVPISGQPKWYHVAVGWKDGEVLLKVDDSVVVQKIGGALKLEGIIEIGGLPPYQSTEARLRELKFYDKCLVSKDQSQELSISNRKADITDVTRLDDLVSSFSFLYESQLAPSIVTVRPSVFKIKTGKNYWISSTLHAPFSIKAEDDGKLQLNLPQTDYCAITIQEADNQNLLANGSFEDGTNGWVLEKRDDNFSDPFIKEGDKYWGNTVPLSSSEQFASTNHVKKTGNYSLEMSKQDKGLLLCSIVKPVAVEAGKDYFFQGYYKAEKAPFGSTPKIFIELTGDGVAPVYIADSYLNPIQGARKDEWLASTGKFTVPATWKNPRAKIYLSLEGTENKIYWDDLSLQLYLPGRAQGPKEIPPNQMVPVKSNDEIIAFWKNRGAYKPEVNKVNGQVVLYIDGKPIGLDIFLPSPLQWPRLGQHKQFGENGVHLQVVPITLGITGCNGDWGKQTWFADEKYDFSPVGERILEALTLDPDAKILLYVHSDPYPEFGDIHPDALWLNQNGKKTVGMKYGSKELEKRPDKWEGYNLSLASESYKRETGKALKALGEYIAGLGVGKAVIGVHIVGGADGQFFSPIWPSHFDRSEANRAAFCAFLKEKYNNDVAAMRKAWGQENVDFTNAQIPVEQARLEGGHLYDVSKGSQRQVSDMGIFNSVPSTELVLALAKSFKEGIGRPFIVTTYYSDISHGYEMNKFALKKILNSTSIDGIVSVPNYGGWRVPGRTGSSNTLVASLRLHNKLSIQELDHRSDYSYVSPWASDFDLRGVGMGPRRGKEDYENEIRRDYALTVTSGGGGWFYALGGNNWINPAYADIIKEVSRVAQMVAEKPVDEHAQIAVFYDENFFSYLNKGINYMLGPIAYSNVKVALYRSGLSWDGFVLSDLTNPSREKYKINIFLSAPSLSYEQLTWIEKNLKKDGNVNIFIYNTAYDSPEGFNKAINQLSGINVNFDPSKTIRYRYSAKTPDSELAKTLKSNRWGETFGPLFRIDDSTAMPLGYLDDGTLVSALKKHKDSTSVYIGLPGGLTPAFLRSLAIEAKVTPIGPEDDVTFAGNGIIAVHAVSSGMKTINWQPACDLLDLTANKIVAKNSNTFTFELQSGQTKWFRKNLE